MPTPSNAIPSSVKGQAFNLSGVIKSSTTGNPITGGLTNLRAYVSVDDGAQALTTTFTGGTAPSEKGATGWFSLDLPAAIMNANKVDVEVRADNAGAVYATYALVNADLSAPAARYDVGTVLRVERLLVNVFDFLHNQQTLVAGVQSAYNRLGVPYASGSVNPATGDGSRNMLI